MRIKNWNRFQHFNPAIRGKVPWVKLYRDVLDDHEWHRLSGEAAKILVMLWLVASEKNGELPPIETLAFRLRIPEKQAIRTLNHLSHWLEETDGKRYHRDIKLASARNQNDHIELEEEKEKEVEKEKERARGPAPVSSSEKIRFAPLVNMTTDEHAALVTKHGSEAVAWMIERLDAFKGSNGKTYKDDARAIRSWVVDAWAKHLASRPVVPQKSTRDALEDEVARAPKPLTPEEYDAIRKYA